MRMILRLVFWLGAGCVAIFSQQPLNYETVSLGGFEDTIQIPRVTGGGASTPFGAWFGGYSRHSGNELWVAGFNDASLELDIRPGPESSNPSQFETIGHRVIFVADDGMHGPEIHADPIFPFPHDSPLIDFQPGNDHAPPVLLGNLAPPGRHHAEARPVWFSTNGYEQNMPVTWVWTCATPDDSPVKAGTYARDSITQVSRGYGRSLFFAARPAGSDRHALFWIKETLPAVEIGSLSETSTVVSPLPSGMHVEAEHFVLYARRMTNGSYTMHQHDLVLSTGAPLGFQSITQPDLATNSTGQACFVTSSGLRLVEKPASSSPIGNRALVGSGPGSAGTGASHLLIGVEAGVAFFQADKAGGGRSLYAAALGGAGQVAVEVDSSLAGAGHFTPYHHDSLVYTKLNAGRIDLRVWNEGTGAMVYLEAFLSVSEISPFFERWSAGFPHLIIKAREHEFAGDMLYTLYNNGAGLFQVAAFWNHPSASVAGYFAAGWPSDTIYAFANDVPSAGDFSEVPNHLVRASLSSGLREDMQMSPDWRSGMYPADYVELGGALYFTGDVGGRRRLCHTTEGAAQSATVIPDVWNPEQLTVHDGRLFFLAHATEGGSGAKSLFEVQATASSSLAVLSSAAGGAAVTRLMPAGSSMYYLSQQSDTLDVLRVMRTGFAGEALVHQFFKDGQDGSSLDSHLAFGESLFFRAPAPGGQKTVFIANGITTAALVLSMTDVPHLAGIWNGSCVIWSETAHGGFSLWTWDGTGGPTLRHQASIEDAPDEVGTDGRSSGVEWEDGFVYNTRLGRLRHLKSTGVDELVPGLGNCITNSLAVLSGRLIFFQFTSQQEFRLLSLGGVGMPPVELLRETCHHKVGIVSDPQKTGGSVWYLAHRSSYPELDVTLVKTDGSLAGTPPIWMSWQIFSGWGELGSYGNHLISPGAGYSMPGESGPFLLNSPPLLSPAVPLPAFRRNQTNIFTYEQILPTSITDAEGDTIGPLCFMPAYQANTRRNGQLLTGAVLLAPGDVFEWIPRAQDSGANNARPGYLIAADAWHSGACDAGRLETGFEEWSRLRFTPEQLADPNLAGMHANPDGDDVSNGLEFVFGRDPGMAEQEAGWLFDLPLESPGSPTTRPAVFRFTRASALAPGVRLRVLVSRDLINWSAIATRFAESMSWTNSIGSTVQEITRQDGRIQVEVQHQMLQAGGFMRIEATFQ
ncbi:MAG: hypothetical protein IPK22_20745 [Verrucomicrobiaceae bacterium]|nr:hypothetical protein [Verrucomicrobiaceae bacterium]